MNYTIGDGMVALALAGGIVGCLHVAHRTRQKRLEIIHQERMAAMDKGIPLPEFPLEPVQRHRPDPHVRPILGTVLLTLSLGAMIVLFANRPPTSHDAIWVSPLPFAFLGAGLIAFHFLKSEDKR